MPSLIPRLGARLLFVTTLAAGCPAPAHSAQAAQATAPLANESPATFTPRVDSFDYVKREVMIPMRDGVKLKTRHSDSTGAHRAPILLTRTPYGATDRIDQEQPARICPRSSTAPTSPTTPS